MRQILLESADPCPDKLSSKCVRYLTGVLNMDRALSLIYRDNTMNNDDATNVKKHEAPINDVRQSTERSGNSYAQISTGNAETPVSPVLYFPQQTSSPITGIAPSACAVRRRGACLRAAFCLRFGNWLRFQQSGTDRFHSAGYVRQGRQSAADGARLQKFLAYLNEHEWETPSVIWTLNFGAVPVYAIAVAGPYASTIGERLRGFLA